MATISVGVLFLLSYLVLLISAEDHRAQSCPPYTFQCATLGVFGYPFATFFNSRCGLSVLNCTEPTQTIGLRSIGPWYDVIESISSNRSFLVADLFLLHVVNSDKCEMFEPKINLPRSPSVNFRILWNTTLWMCPQKFDVTPGNTSGTLRRIRSCKDYEIYHNNFTEEAVPGCLLVLYPKILIVELSDKCSQCIGDGGFCQDLNDEAFRCSNKKNESKKRRRVIVVGIAGGTVVILALFLAVWCIRKKKIGSMELGSRDISFQPKRMGTDLEISKVYFSVPVFSYNELEEATKSFDSSKELGDGGYGTVYYGKLKDGREVAVKRLYQRNYRQLEQFMNEIELLACLRHHNLVSLYGCTSRHSRELLLVYEYVPNGTVADHLHGDQAKCGILTWPIRMSIAIETASALSYLHASDIIHRDVKSNNILLDNHFSVKVADFGLSRVFPLDVTHISTAPQGTPGYLDPEYHQCYQLTDKSDVYSFGVVLVELISSLPAIDAKRQHSEINLSYFAMKRIRSNALDELIDYRLGSNYKTKKMITSVSELAFQCLQDRKEFRPSMLEVLEALKQIADADYEVHESEKTEKADGILKDQTDADNIWLLRNTENPLSPKSVMHKWASSKSITPTAS